MKQLVRFFAIRLAKVLLIEIKNFLVLMGFTLGLVAVFLVDRDLTLADDFHVTVVIWLSAAANTAAWASHDFDCLEVALASLNAVKKLSRIAETVSNTCRNGCRRDHEAESAPLARGFRR